MKVMISCVPGFVCLLLWGFTPVRKALLMLSSHPAYGRTMGYWRKPVPKPFGIVVLSMPCVAPLQPEKWRKAWVSLRSIRTVVCWAIMCLMPLKRGPKEISVISLLKADCIAVFIPKVCSASVPQDYAVSRWHPVCRRSGSIWIWIVYVLSIRSLIFVYPVQERNCM